LARDSYAVKGKSWHARFLLGINGRGIWLEFKRDYSCELSPEQEEFRVCCAYQNIEWHVVYSAHEAIQIVEKTDALSDFTVIN
jgi:hypothetical protein